MIPAAGENYEAIQMAASSSYTYRLNRETKRVEGMIGSRPGRGIDQQKELEAIEQRAYLLLHTERYDHLIYSWAYGAELMQLIGMPISYALPELKRVIYEALMQDEDITGVEDMEFTAKRGTVCCSFVIRTKYGDIQAEKAVEL